MLHGNRIPHIMKIHKSNNMPASLLFFDTETISQPNLEIKDVDRQILNFGYAYALRYEKGNKTREEWCRFKDNVHFWSFLKSRTDKERPLYCFAHNLGFDLTILDFWHWTEKEEFKVEYFVLSDPPTFIIGRWQGRKIVFIDTLNYWRTSLAKIGDSIGLKKLARPTKRSSKAYWDKYAKRDVEVLALAVDRLMRYVKDNDLGQFGLSAASMAMSTFKHRFMKHEIFIHDNRQVLACERAAYYGGYTACFFVGRLEKERVYKLDINSMYPFCMRGLFPCKYVYKEENISASQLRRRMQEHGCIARVQINANKHTYPCYFKDRLCYCNGQFVTTLCGPELKRALNNGDIHRVEFSCYYDMKPLFREYMDFFYKERLKFKKQGDDVGQYFIKLFMNMLYGKFGQLGYDTAVLTSEALERVYNHQGISMPDCYRNTVSLFEEYFSEVDWKPIGLNRPVTLRRINNVTQIKIPNGEHNESFPAIAAYVTSLGRELLLEYITIAGPRCTYYCDTDSILCTRQGYDRLERAGKVSDSTLGLLKLEGISDGAIFRGLKDYTFAGLSRVKGIRGNAQQVSVNTFKQQHFEGIKSVLKRGYGPYIDITTITKRLNRKYSKGVVTGNGWVKAFTLPITVEL